MTAYSPFPYIATAPALALARAADLSVVGGLWLARLASLALWLAGVGLAIRRAPTGKWLLATVALLPMSVFQAASISGDPVTQIVLFLFLSELLRFGGQEDSPSFEGKPVFLLGLALLIGLVKPGYAPVTLAAIGLLAQNRSRSRVGWIIGIIVTAHLTTLAWAALVQVAEQPALSGGADAAGQLRFIVSHPFEFLGVLARTTWLSLPAWADGMVGNLGHLDVDIPVVATGLALVFVVAAGALDPPPKPRPWLALSLFASFLATGVVVMAMAYLGWTAVGAPVIQGVQGRYFLLALPFALLGLPGLPPPQNQLARRALPWVSAAVLAATSAQMIRQYYEF